MLRAAFALRRLRNLRTPWLGGASRLSSSKGASSNPNPNGHFHSETEARELFELWCKKYGKTYASEEEKLSRLGRFKETLEWCTLENQKHDIPKHCRFSTYANADQTEEEFLSRCGGWRGGVP